MQDDHQIILYTLMHCINVYIINIYTYCILSYTFIFQIWCLLLTTEAKPTWCRPQLRFYLIEIILNKYYYF